MPAFVSILRDILLLRRGPQDLPYSPSLLAMLAVICVVVQAGARTIPIPVGLAESFVSAVIETLLILVTLRLALNTRRLGNRFVQAASGLIGCNLIFALLNLPVALAFGKVPLDAAGHIVPEHATLAQLLLGPLIFALGIWQLAAIANVLRHSLEISFAASIAAILGWIALASVLLSIVAAPIGG